MYTAKYYVFFDEDPQKRPKHVAVFTYIISILLYLIGENRSVSGKVYYFSQRHPKTLQNCLPFSSSKSGYNELNLPKIIFFFFLQILYTPKFSYSPSVKKNIISTASFEMSMAFADQQPVINRHSLLRPRLIVCTVSCNKSIPNPAISSDVPHFVSTPNSIHRLSTS
jgi:hypothetical protein